MGKYDKLFEEVIFSEPTVSGDTVVDRLMSEIRDMEAWRWYSSASFDIDNLLPWVETYLKEYCGTYFDSGVGGELRIRKPLFIYRSSNKSPAIRGVVYGNGAIECWINADGDVIRVDFFIKNNDAVRFGFPNKKFIFNNKWFETFGV